MERNERIDIVGITYLPLWGIFLIYRQWFAKSPSYLTKESLIFRDKSIFSLSGIILPLSITLRGVRDLEVGKFADNGFSASRRVFVANFPYGVEFSYGVEWPINGLEIPDRPPQASLGRV